MYFFINVMHYFNTSSNGMNPEARNKSGGGGFPLDRGFVLQSRCILPMSVSCR